MPSADQPDSLRDPAAVGRGRGRFAPSPTGRLHFGSLVAALGSWLVARSRGDEWIVRIEDIDRIREVAGSAADILATLTAFGLHSDRPVVRQSDRLPLYEAALSRLMNAGLAYPCACSRHDLEPFAGRHPAHCVTPPDARRARAWRMRTGAADIAFDDAIQGPQRQWLADAVGDFVIWRADGGCAYQLAVVVDDAEQGITDVVRGADLLDSTPRQILLQRALGLATPRHAHLPLATDAEGRKLSKHDAALPVDARDPLPALRAALVFLGQQGTSATTVAATLAHAVREFDLAAVPAQARAPLTHAAMRNDSVAPARQNATSIRSTVHQEHST